MRLPPPWPNVQTHRFLIAHVIFLSLYDKLMDGFFLVGFSARAKMSAVVASPGKGPASLLILFSRWQPNRKKGSQGQLENRFEGRVRCWDLRACQLGCRPRWTDQTRVKSTSEGLWALSRRSATRKTKRAGLDPRSQTVAQGG